MWESRGIRHDLGRCDRQRVFEQRSFAPFRRKYESLLERAAHRRRARGMRSRIRGNWYRLSAAGLAIYAALLLVLRVPEVSQLWAILCSRLPWGRARAKAQMSVSMSAYPVRKEELA